MTSFRYLSDPDDRVEGEGGSFNQTVYLSYFFLNKYETSEVNVKTSRIYKLVLIKSEVLLKYM